MRQPNEKKYLASLVDGGLDADSDISALGPNKVVNAENVRWGSTDYGVTETVESVGGNIRVSEALPSLTFTTIGAAEDIENGRLIAFKKCITGPWDRITCYDKFQNREYLVVTASQIDGGLGFDGLSIIHSARVINGLVYWTDNLNEPRKLNIDAGIKLNHPDYVTETEPYSLPIRQDVVYVIRRPPLYPLTIEKGLDNTFENNFIKTGSFQFATRYYYRDGETSVLSVYSELANYNANGENSNYIAVSLDLDEYIDQDVQRVELVVRVANTSNFYLIKTWDKDIASELAEIEAHNSGTPLSYNFYNDTYGEFLDQAYAVKPFDSVPLKSKTLEIARNRLFLANNVIGYDTPKTTSLSITPETEEQGAGTTATVFYLQWGGSPGTLKYPMYIPTGDVPGYYRVTVNDGVLPSSPTAFADLTFIGATYSDLIAYYTTLGLAPPVVFYATAYITITGVANAVNYNTAFKAGSPYQLGVVFFDHADRKCGVVTSDSQLLEIAPLEWNPTTFTTQLAWSLSNLDAFNEIPTWATSYAIVITKCLKTRFFVQARAIELKYVSKNSSGEYDFSHTTYNRTRVGVAVDVTVLNSNGMGYVYQAGDLIDIVTSSATFTLSVIDQSGKWVVCELADLGSLSGVTAQYEIYAPYTKSTNEPYYEVGQKYPITNPGQGIRTYSVTSGVITGDITVLERNDGTNDYFNENMSPNDKFWQEWNTNSGRPNFVTNIGQSIEKNTIAYSNTYISRGRTNGLSSFDALDEEELPIECGQIQKLQVTGKVQNEQGAIMLAVCEMQAASLYLGEVQLVGSSSNAFVAQDAGVIGTVNVLKGNYGTINPESVCEYRGTVFWVDIYNGKVIQYASNGLFPISSYKMTRFWRLFGKQYNSMSYTQIEALGTRPFIFTTVDPHHNELLISIPKLLNTPPKGYLPDYPSTVYPFDIWDGQAKTLVYKLGVGPENPYWVGAYTFSPDWLATLQNDLYSFKYGLLWLHNQPNYAKFYDTQYESTVSFASNVEPSLMKVYNAISVESNMIPTFTYLYTNLPIQQSTDIMDYEWRNYEGFYYANIKRNKLEPNASGYATNGLLTGQRMRSYACFCQIKFTVSNTPLELRFINFKFEQSKGHATI